MASEERSLAKTESKQLEALQGRLQKLVPAINQAIPATMKKYLTPDALTKVAFLAVRKSPDLMRCTPESIFQFVMDSATLGLEVGGQLGHAYLVPFRNNKKGIMEAQLVVGYQGYINLARRSGEVSSITAQVVYENDVFDIDLASGKPPIHKPCLKGDRGQPYLVYCVAFFKDGGYHPEIMTKDDIDKIRKKSKMADGPAWRDNYWAMGLKSCIRKAKKMWPLSTNTAIELSKADQVEDRTEDWSVSLADAPEAPEAPATRADQVLAKLSEGDNPVTGETAWEEPTVDAQVSEPSSEEMLAYVRTRWAELMPDARSDKDIMQALKGLGIERPDLGKCSNGELQKLLNHFDRKPRASA